MNKLLELRKKHKEKQDHLNIEEKQDHLNSEEKQDGMNSKMIHKNIDKKKVIRIVVLLIILTATLIYFIVDKDLKFVGVVEATILPNTAEVSGKILEMPVELGQHVQKGDILAVIDSTNQDYALEQLEITLLKRKLALSDIQVGQGGVSTSQAEINISIAKANYNSTHSALNKASSDYKNALTLYEEGAISKDILDVAKVKFDSASNAATIAKAQLDSATNQFSTESMSLDIIQIESQIRQAQDLLDKYVVSATTDGVIMNKSYVLGDLVSPGYNLIDIASDNEKYLVFYIPKEYLNYVEYNQELDIISNDGEKINGVVKYIDVKSEYTPKDMQSTANKNKESLKIKVLLPMDSSLKPGVEAEVNLKSVK